jgi:hypothetical protein
MSMTWRERYPGGPTPGQVPPQPWYMTPTFSVLIGGILPFGAVFIELFFILTSMWLHQVGRCRLTVSKPELKVRLVSALETKM